MLMIIKKLPLNTLLLSATLVALAACSDGSNRQHAAVKEPTVAALYDAAANPPVLPFPNAAYIADSGRLNMALAPDTTPGDLGNAVVALNTLDGFSTIAPFYVDFAEAIDAATITAGDNVRVFEVAVDGAHLPTAVVAELQADVDYAVTVSAVMDSRILIKPLRPLNSSASYLVGVSSSLKAQSGLKMGPSADYEDLRSNQQSVTEGSLNRQYLANLVAAQEALLVEKGMDVASIVSSFSFPTHSTGDVLAAINSVATATRVELIRPNMTINGELLPLTSAPLAGLAAVFGLTPGGQVDIYTGTFELPYYMNIPAGPSDDSVNDGYMRNSAGEPILDPSNLLQSTPLTVPILVAIPNTSRDPSLLKPAAGWPVAIYHHGISGNRTNMLLIADALAARGVAMVAIDQVVHGVLPNDVNLLPLSVFAAAGVDFYDPAHERHFNLDLNADGEIDLAGDNFSSPRNLLTGRDNLRQSVSDLIYLTRTLPTVVLPDVPGIAFDSSKIDFVSLSLGSIVGTILAGVNSDIRAFSLSAPGGGGVKFSEGAPNGNAGVVASLAALGLEQGSQDYEDYLTLLTTIGGPGDPINYARSAGEIHPIHVTEIVGDGTPEFPPDQTIPNQVLNIGQYEGLVVETAPLAGTEPLIRAFNLQALLDNTMNPEGLHVVARFLRGDHQSQVNPSNLLSPFALPEVTQEIHQQTASFIASGGTAIDVANSSLLEMNYSAPGQ